MKNGHLRQLWLAYESQNYIQGLLKVLYLVSGSARHHNTRAQNKVGDLKNDNGVGAGLILYDSTGIFLDGVSLAETDGNGDPEVTNLPTIDIHVGPLDSNDIEINYGGKQLTCPGNHCKLGKYDGGKHEADFGFTWNTFP
ncbi:hypothetical protein SCUP234_01785 [Seiridium cupressi]